MVNTSNNSKASGVHRHKLNGRKGSAKVSRNRRVRNAGRRALHNQLRNA